MRRILALTRATWLTAVSYRMGMVFSILALVVTVIPVYFVSQALQPVVAESIRNEGGNYFAFLVLGLVSMTFVLAAVGAFPARLSSAISSGTLEAVLATPTRIPEFIVGLIGYDLLWAGVKAGLMVLAAQQVQAVRPAAQGKVARAARQHPIRAPSLTSTYGTSVQWL